MVISSSGLVLTNNHVIDQATSVSATLVTSGKTYTAKVIGYDSTDDVALLQLVGASGLTTVNLPATPARSSWATQCSRSAMPRERAGCPLRRRASSTRRTAIDHGERQRHRKHREPDRHAADERTNPGG